MFGLKLKRRAEKSAKIGETENEKTLALISEETEDGFESENAAIYSGEEKESSDLSVVLGSGGSNKKSAKNDFARFAEILSVSEEKVIDECKLFQIRKIMSKLDRAVVRYGVKDGEMARLFNNGRASGLRAIALSPAYLGAAAKCCDEEETVKVCATVDFPFGESSFNVKFSEMKNCVKKGVDEVIAVFPAALLTAEKSYELKKQLKKTGGLKRIKKGAAVSAADVDEEGLKRFIKFSERFLDYTVFLFGDVTKTELKNKLSEIKKYAGQKPVKVMANVKNTEEVKTLIRLGADGIITPFAEKVAKELFKEFGIKSVKLV